MALTIKGHNKKMQKDADTYNLDVVKRIAKVINDGRIGYDDKMEMLKKLIDTVYVDGWNHGYGRIEAEQRETLTGGNLYV